MMRLITMDKPQCLLFSAAMILHESPVELIVETGHDGMDIWWSEYDDHRQFRGHTMQEMIDVFLQRGFALTPIEAFPMQTPASETKPRATFPEYQARFYRHIARKQAILIGQTERGNEHAWAWSGTKVYDPRGGNPNIRDLTIKEAWIIHSIKCRV